MRTTHFEIEVKDSNGVWYNTPTQHGTYEQAEHVAKTLGVDRTGKDWERCCRIVKVDTITEIVRTVQD